MSKSLKKRAKKVGAAPGTLMHLGRERGGSVAIEVIEYDPEHLQKRQVQDVGELFPSHPPPLITWVNVEGLPDAHLLQRFGTGFGIHPLVLEDVLATDQRAKADDYGSYLFVVLKMLAAGEKGAEIRSEQVSFVLGERLLISFQEGIDGDVFGPVRARLENPQGQLRARGADHLLYALMDITVDNYYLVLEALEDKIEALEDEVLVNASTATVQEINRLKREMLFLHKAVWPLRETVGSLQRRDSHLIEEGTSIFLRDLYDHTVQVLDTLETLREMLSGLLDIYLSSVSNRLNVAMKFLTVIATIFMPLSFICGVYGMNFKFAGA
ncbi:magnesium/cobalt transporter CorA [Geomonas sp. RF6]|uniref:magnesium/cobalt transporter CorA n=1 Tax=Geomonas sp. RF6 TaxID=2897342 RepID=UPI002EDA4D11